MATNPSIAINGEPLEKRQEHEDHRLLSAGELRANLEQIGRELYHYRHPFHLRMHEGKLTRGQLQAWALNRYYYQSQIPVKDALILAKSDDPAFRRAWRKRILDHDGSSEQAIGAGLRQTGVGGIEKWLQLAEATGLDRKLVIDCKLVLPGVRYAVDAYLRLVQQGSLLVAVASSLTELFSRDLIALRIDFLRRHYPWLNSGLAYFEGRLTQAPEDAQFAFAYVAEHARTREQQEQAMDALRQKCHILWAQLDAIYYSYVEPGWPPPGAFRTPDNPGVALVGRSEEAHGGD
jgi:pyrroloquinoline-quinone synthase